MSHHSVESMRDIAFRKGRHGFDSDDDYLRALRGEELEDEFLDEEDEPLDEEDEDEMAAEFEDVIFHVITESPVKTVNMVFDWMMKASDWIMKVEDGRDPGTLTFIHNGTTVGMSVVGEDLVFGAVGNGADCRGRYDFEYFQADIRRTILMNGDSPCCAVYCAVCDAVKDLLDMARDWAYVWKRDIARFLTGCQGDLELQATRNGNDTRLRFVRRSLMKSDDTIWVLLNPTAPDMELKDEDGRPARLLQWLFERNGLIDVLRPE